MTRAARAAGGVAPPPAVHGAVKGVNPNLRARNTGQQGC